MKYILITLGFMVAGLISLVVSSNIVATSPFKPYLDQATSILLITGIFTIIQKSITDKDMYKTIREMFKIHESIEDTGIKEVHNESQAYNFTEFIEKSDSLIILLNDGNRWLMNNIVAMEERFKKNVSTEIFTVDPDSEFTDALAKKTGMSIDDLKKKIRDTWTKLTERYNSSGKTSTLKIYRLKNYPTFSAFMNEKKVIMSLYQNCSGRSNVPLFIAEKNNEVKSLFNFIHHDFDELRKESSIEFDSTKKSNGTSA